MSQGIPKEESVDEEVDLWAMVSRINLGCLSEFYSSAESWFRPQPDHPRDTLDAGNGPNHSDTNREQCLRYLRISVFLMLCAHLEEMLCLYCKREECHTEKGSGLARFKCCVNDLLDGKLKHCQAWCFLKDAFEIRNALLHANGRAALMNVTARNKIQGTVKKHNELFRWPEVLVPVRSNSDTSLKLKKVMILGSKSCLRV
jgi:hypothetical protein